MSAFEEHANFIEEQRERLREGVERIVDIEHWNCTHPVEPNVEHEFERALRTVDGIVVAGKGTYAPTLKRLADMMLTEAERVETEGIGNE